MQLDQARDNMIKQQLRTWGVLDEDLLALIAQTPRENFVPEEYKSLAYADMNIPIGHEQKMLTPMEEARILQALAVKPHEKVLEVGTGSGYVTSLLAQQAKQVISVDIISDFMTPAAKRLADLSISNTTFITGNAAQGWAEDEPYDIIAVTGSLPFLPQAFRDQLKVGGRIFAIIGQAPAMEASLITRMDEDTWSQQGIFETVVPPLLEALQPEQFHF